MDVGILLVRGAVGFALLGQAIAKLRPGGRASTIAFFRNVGFEPASHLAMLAAAVELAGGAALMAGFMTPLAAAGAVGVLVNASVVNAARGWASVDNGAEYPVTLGLVSAGLAFSGPGGLSLDGLLGWADPPVLVSVAAIGVSLVAALPLLAARQRRLSRRAEADAAERLVPAA